MAFLLIYMANKLKIFLINSNCEHLSVQYYITQDSKSGI